MPMTQSATTSTKKAAKAAAATASARAASKAKDRSVIRDKEALELAHQMTLLDARLQITISETGLSYERLSRLYKEIHHKSPSKGLLPFSESWYLSWLNNLHASAFYVHYIRIGTDNPELSSGWHLVHAYRMYLQSDLALALGQKEPTLSFTRAWILVRLVKTRSLLLATCSQCELPFVTHGSYSTCRHNLCKICNPPKRTKSSIFGIAGKAKASHAQAL